MLSIRRHRMVEFTSMLACDCAGWMLLRVGTMIGLREDSFPAYSTKRSLRQMIRLLFSITVFALALTGSARAERADALGIDGIYEGKIGMQLKTSKGKKEHDAPAKFVFLPDGRSGILTAQHPEGVVAVAMRGELKGNVFHAVSEGKLDFGGFHSGMRWDITFNRKAGTAEFHGKASKLPKWAHDDDLRYTFRKVRKR